MTAAFDDMNFHDLVGLLTEEEQEDLRPVVFRLVASHGRSAADREAAAVPRRRLSFAGTVEAEPDFASTSQEMLWRDLGGRE
ncbi:hypothetical protein ACQP2U_38010 [Nocardia sp. CA-084685]|uniref:hypothetical protein n=1 Tax=Nocardia sp. CA-084685 TaxID=3239970 RepID=UPI003D96F97F